MAAFQRKGTGAGVGCATSVNTSVDMTREPCSFFNCLNATLLEVLEVIEHFFEPFGRSDPPNP